MASRETAAFERQDYLNAQTTARDATELRIILVSHLHAYFVVTRGRHMPKVVGLRSHKMVIRHRSRDVHDQLSYPLRRYSAL
jgi:hypothetical protein